MFYVTFKLCSCLGYVYTNTQGVVWCNVIISCAQDFGAIDNKWTCARMMILHFGLTSAEKYIMLLCKTFFKHLILNHVIYVSVVPQDYLYSSILINYTVSAELLN